MHGTVTHYVMQQCVTTSLSEAGVISDTKSVRASSYKLC